MYIPCTYIHTYYIRTYIHTYIQTYRHTDIHMYIHTMYFTLPKNTKLRVYVPQVCNFTVGLKPKLVSTAKC